jgi:hypothetical protein
MKILKLFSVHRTVEKLPEKKLSKPLLMLYWISYLAIPVFLLFLELGGNGIMKTTFENSSQILSERQQIIIILKSYGIVIASSVITFLIVGILIYVAVRILAKFNIHLEFWKLFNLYLYARSFQQILGMLLNLIFFALFATVLKSWIGSNENSFLFASLPLTYIPTAFFYGVFIWGLIITMSRNKPATV